MLTLPFESVHAALNWYFNKSWVKPPARPRSLDLVRYQYSPTRDDPELVTKAFYAIRATLRSLTARNYCIVSEHYRRRGATQAEVALSFGLMGSDRSIRRIRDEVLVKVQDDMITVGVVRLPKPGEKKYARDEGTNP